MKKICVFLNLEFNLAVTRKPVTTRLIQISGYWKKLAPTDFLAIDPVIVLAFTIRSAQRNSIIPIVKNMSEYLLILSQPDINTYLLAGCLGIDRTPLSRYRNQK